MLVDSRGPLRIEIVPPSLDLGAPSSAVQRAAYT